MKKLINYIKEEKTYHTLFGVNKKYNKDDKKYYKEVIQTIEDLKEESSGNEFEKLIKSYKRGVKNTINAIIERIYYNIYALTDEDVQQEIIKNKFIDSGIFDKLLTSYIKNNYDINKVYKEFDIN